MQTLFPVTGRPRSEKYFLVLYDFVYLFPGRRPGSGAIRPCQTGGKHC
jgi:hypothetical protein